VTAPDPNLAVVQSELRHQNEALARIEKKIDKASDDHEARLRKIEASDPTGTQAAVKLLQESDRKWAALVLVLGVVAQVVLKVVWP
jgi:hypothetical protein